MNEWIPRSLVLPVLFLAGLFLTACARDPLVSLELRHYPPSMWVLALKPNGLLVSVEPFVDVRPGDKFLGQSRPLGGDDTFYGLAGGDFGEVTAQMLATYLDREKGWQAWFGKASAGQPKSGPDVTLTGRILECEMDVRDWGLVWLVAARAKLSVEIKNKSDGKADPEEIVIRGAANNWFFRYNPSRLSWPVTDALLGAFRELAEGTVVKGKRLEKAPPSI